MYIKSNLLEKYSNILTKLSLNICIASILVSLTLIACMQTALFYKLVYDGTIIIDNMDDLLLIFRVSNILLSSSIFFFVVSIATLLLPWLYRRIKK